MTLRDATAEKLKGFLRSATHARKEGEPLSVARKNDIRASLRAFWAWLKEEGRVEANVIDLVPRAKPPKGEDDRRHVRRSLRPKAIRALIQAATDYPVKSRMTNRGGRTRRDGTRPTPKPANLSPDTVAKLTAKGQERRMPYLLTLFTGLRRGELSRVGVGHLKLNKRLIDLPGTLTKNGRRALIPLLSRWLTNCGCG